MYYIDTADQAALLVGLCLPFCIVVFSIWFRNAQALSRLLGMAFWAPFLLNAASFLTSEKTGSEALASSSTLLLLVILSFLLMFKAAKRYFKPVAIGIWLFPVLILVMINSFHAVQNLLSVKSYTLPLLILLALFNMYLLKREDDYTSLLFWAMLPAAAEGAAAGLFDSGILAYIAPAFSLTAYILFAIYFHRVFLEDILKKVSDVDMRMDTVNRSIDREVKKRVFEIERVNEKLVSISKTDPLSNALNRVAVMDFIENLATAAPPKQFSILMFDIDDFKVINDTLGHIAGDKCIRLFSMLAKSSLRGIDAFGRFGGDEFVMVLPGATASQAFTVGERFRKKIEVTVSPHFTISAGIASSPEDGTAVNKLIEAADRYLYISKGRGKNVISYKNNS